MMHPMLPPEGHYELYRALWNGPRMSRRRHPSSLDLHELGGADDSLRPDPLWMAIRRSVDWVARFQIVQAFQAWLHRPEKVESTLASRSDECGLPYTRLDTGTAPSRNRTAL